MSCDNRFKYRKISLSLSLSLSLSRSLSVSLADVRRHSEHIRKRSSFNVRERILGGYTCVESVLEITSPLCEALIASWQEIGNPGWPSALHFDAGRASLVRSNLANKSSR